jgi:acetoin utilization deacetylase AcuC-like enzyme
VTKLLRAVTLPSAKGRIVSLLEGGYELGALGRSVAAHLRGMIA